MARKKFSRSGLNIKRKRPPFNLRSRITSALRRIWLYSPARRAAVAAWKAKGNICVDCKKPHAKLDADHINEVVPAQGFNGDWTGYIDRLFNGELIGRCKACHHERTQAMRKMRAEFKKKAAKRRKK